MKRFLFGWVRIQICTACPERFLNLCRYQGVIMWDIHFDSGGMEYSTYQRQIPLCKKAALKAGTEMSIVKQAGFPVWCRRMGQRKTFFLSGGLFFAVLLFYSLRIWSITYEGNYYYTEDQLQTFLQEQGIYHGVKKRNISCETIEQMLRDRFERISWSASVVEGTRLKIYLAENYGTLKVTPADQTPQDILAQEDGIVESILVRKGTALVKPGDEVKKGQILISSGVARRNDAGEITGYQMAHAEGEVCLRVVYAYKDAVLAEYEEKEYIRKQKEWYEIYFNRYHFKIYTPERLLSDVLSKVKGVHRTAMETSDQIGIQCAAADGLAKIRIYGKERWSYKAVKKLRGKKQAEGVLKERLAVFLEKLEKNADRVVENKVRIYYDAGVYRAEGRLSVLKMQTERRKADESILEKPVKTQETEEQR